MFIPLLNIHVNHCDASESWHIVHDLENIQMISFKIMRLNLTSWPALDAMNLPIIEEWLILTQKNSKMKVHIIICSCFLHVLSNIYDNQTAACFRSESESQQLISRIFFMTSLVYVWSINTARCWHFIQCAQHAQKANIYKC